MILLSPRSARFSAGRSSTDDHGKVCSDKARQGSVFIIVLWISFGLVVLSLYFANAMNFELRSADNRTAALEADAGISGAARYVTFFLQKLATNGAVPDVRYYGAADVPVGETRFWVIGRSLLDQQKAFRTPIFGLVDEASKLNLNTATVAMLEWLPGMTAEFAAAIVDWRDADSTATASGAEDEIYGRLVPPRRCKNASFESVEELRLVYGATDAILYGEDANRNGVLDPNENDGNVSLPEDNRDGKLDQGILSFVTVHSKESATTSDGTARVTTTDRNGLRALVTQYFPNKTVTIPNGGFPSVLEFALAAQNQLSAAELAQIEPGIQNTNLVGLINVNTASEEVLACVPGIGFEKAAALIAYRQSNSEQSTSISWVKEVLTDQAAIRAAGPYLTGMSAQFSADIAAVGRFGRGFRRTQFVFDVTDSTPKILYRQDLTHLGWPLGPDIRDDLQLAKGNRR